MAGFVKLLMIAFTAAMVENAIFSRALVTRKMLFLKNREEILTFSAVITLMTVISGVICYAADSLVLYPRGVSIYIRFRTLCPDYGGSPYCHDCGSFPQSRGMVCSCEKCAADGWLQCGSAGYHPALFLQPV